MAAVPSSFLFSVVGVTFASLCLQLAVLFCLDPIVPSFDRSRPGRRCIATLALPCRPVDGTASRLLCAPYSVLHAIDAVRGLYLLDSCPCGSWSAILPRYLYVGLPWPPGNIVACKPQPDRNVVQSILCGLALLAGSTALIAHSNVGAPSRPYTYDMQRLPAGQHIGRQLASAGAPLKCGCGDATGRRARAVTPCSGGITSLGRREGP